MKKLVFLLLSTLLLVQSVSAMDFTAPRAPVQVRSQVEAPAKTVGEGLWNVVKAALPKLDASLAEAGRCCLKVCAAGMICTVIRFLSTRDFMAADLVCSLLVASVLFSPSASLIRQGENVIRQLNDYAKLLLPVMTGALAAQGGVSSSAALYTAAALFNSLLSAAVTRLLIPLLYLYLALSVGYAAVREELLGRFRDLLRWSAGWLLKLTLYVFTGFLAVTGVVSGTADQAAMKAAKLTISGAVPVVGSILSDATEAVLVSAGVMRSAAGAYGVMTVCALGLSPFLHVGVQYLLLKATAAVCKSFDGGAAGGLTEDFSAAMGLMLGMIGTQCVLILISTVCLMKGVGG